MPKKTEESSNTNKKAVAKKTVTKKAVAKKTVAKKTAAKRKTAAEKAAVDASVQTVPLTPEERHQRIALEAYYRSMHRGFAPGHEEEDWLWAEKKVAEDLATLSQAGA